MKRYYILECDLEPEFLQISIPAEIVLDRKAVLNGELQYLNDNPAEFYFADEAALEPWYYEEPGLCKVDELYLFSEGMIDLLADAEVENLFLKPVFLTLSAEAKETEEDEDEDLAKAFASDDEAYFPYYLPAIKPLDAVLWNQSKFESVGQNGEKKLTGKFYIDQQKVGNFKIFRLKNVSNNFWIVDQEIKELLEEAMLLGVALVETSAYEGEVR